MILTNNCNFNFLQWAELCKSYLVEARWYHNGYTPTLQEYLNNAHVSIAGRVILMHANLSTSFTSPEEILKCFERAENMISYSSLIFRLANDIATSPVRRFININRYLLLMHIGLLLSYFKRQCLSF